MTEVGTILIYDEEESRRNTERQMQQTAAMYSFGQGPGVTEVGGPPPRPPAAVTMPNENRIPLSPQQFVQRPDADHLLITPSGRSGAVRLIRMRGPEKREAWGIEESAVQTLIDVMRSFGINLTDLREEDADG